jgi:aconitate decarboxylase
MAITARAAQAARASSENVGATRRLAAWASALDYSALPEPTRQAARLLMTDALGCGLFGATQPWARIVAEHVLSTAPADEAGVWGSPEGAAAAYAPLANGTFVHAFEYDDLHPQAVLHGTAQVMPAALAITELRGRGPATGAHPGWLPDGWPSDQLFLAAVVTGLEVGARVGLATGAGQLRNGFHPSPNTGALSAAATGARLLELDATATEHALGIAASGGGALMAAQYGAMVKRAHPGLAAQAGVQAALLAARGMTGTAAALEAPYGGFAHAHLGAGSTDALARLDAEVERLGVTWETDRFGIKPYPCCGSNHTAVDAYLSVLQEAPDLTADRIAELEVRCSTLTHDHVGWRFHPTGEPADVSAAQMNLPYTLAVLAMDRAMSVQQYAPARVRDRQVLELADRVRMVADSDIDRLGPELRHAIRLTVTTRDGRRFHREARHGRAATDPIPPDQVLHKFRSQAMHLLDTHAVQELERTLLRFGDDANAVASLSRALRPLRRTNQ